MSRGNCFSLHAQDTMQAAAAESAAGHEGHAPITFKVEYGMS